MQEEYLSNKQEEKLGGLIDNLTKQAGNLQKKKKKKMHNCNRLAYGMQCNGQTPKKMQCITTLI